MILGDRELRYYIEKKLIVVEPFDPQIIRENGLDLRLGDEIARLKPTSEPFDPRNPPQDPSKYYVIERGESFVINPHEHVLLTTLEYIKLPSDLMAFVNLRSSFARLGIYAPPCVHPDTVIHTSHGLIVEASQADTVISYRPETGESYVATAKKVLTKNTTGHLVRIATNLGWIDVTPHHRFLVFDPLGIENIWVEKAAYSVERGDLVAVPKRISFYNNVMEKLLEPPLETCVKPRSGLLDKIVKMVSETTWDENLGILPDIHKLLSTLLNDGCISLSTLTHLLQVLGLETSFEDILDQLDYYSISLKGYRPLRTLVRRIDDKLSYLIGVITGSDILRVNSGDRIKIVAEFKEPEHLLKFIETLNEIAVSPSDLSIEKIEDRRRVYVELAGDTKDLLVYNFPESFSENHSRRCVPLNIQESSADIVGSFLRGLFATRRAEKLLGYNVRSTKLAKQLQLLLLRYGIHARLGNHNGDYVVEINTSTDVEVFTREVLGVETRITSNAKTVKTIPLSLFAARVLEKLSTANKSLVHEIIGFIKNRELPYDAIPTVLEELIAYKPAGYTTAYKHILFSSKYYWDRVIDKKLYDYNGYVVDWQTETHWYLAGIYVTHNTIVDAGFEGTLTIELVGGEFPVRLYRGDRFLHLVFAKLTGPVEKPYRGRYLRQRGVTIPWFTKDSL